MYACNDPVCLYLDPIFYNHDSWTHIIKSTLIFCTCAPPPTIVCYKHLLNEKVNVNFFFFANLLFTVRLKTELISISGQTPWMVKSESICRCHEVLLKELKLCHTSVFVANRYIIGITTNLSVSTGLNNLRSRCECSKWTVQKRILIQTIWPHSLNSMYKDWVVIIIHPECLSKNGMCYIHGNPGNQMGMQNGEKTVIKRLRITAFLLQLEKSSFYKDPVGCQLLWPSTEHLIL